jgi:hypothetical protein
VIEGNFVGVNAAGTGSVGIKTSGGAAGTPGGNNVFGIEISGGTNNTVGGATAAARNVVGFNADGIEVDDGGQNNIIQGNFSGVGADGITPVGNNLHGIVLRSDDNLPAPLGPGGSPPGTPNEGPVSGNIIGLDPNTFSGLGNLIEFNGTGGVAVFGNPQQNNGTQIQNSGNSILGNSIFENGRNNPTFLLGIDLTNQFVYPRDDGRTPNDGGLGLPPMGNSPPPGAPAPHGNSADPNNFQNFPILTSVAQVPGGVQVTGTFTEAVEPNTTLRIEFFANNPDPLGGIPEGQIFLGSTNITTNPNGVVSFSLTLADPGAAPGQFITADATNLTADPSIQPGNLFTKFDTSEFSPAMQLPFPPPPPPPPAAAPPPPVLKAFLVPPPSGQIAVAGFVQDPAGLLRGLPLAIVIDWPDGTETFTGLFAVNGGFSVFLKQTHKKSKGHQPVIVHLEQLVLTSFGFVDVLPPFSVAT